MSIVPALTAIICSMRRRTESKSAPYLSSGLDDRERRIKHIMQEYGVTFNSKKHCWTKNGKELSREGALFGGDEFIAEFLRQAIKTKD